MAKREIVLVLSMLLLIASSEGVNEFDYYQVSLQWQPATCSSSTLPIDQCANDPTDRFSIHGVWPSPWNGNSPTCSGTPPYDGAQISTIRTRLNQDWPSVIYGTNPTLWSHEWTTHGTCSYPSLSQLQYFQFGLNTYDTYKVLSIFRKNGIYPSGEVYSRTEMENAIRTETGFLPALRCNTNYWTQERQFHEILFCFTKNDRTLRNCPLNAVTCGSNLFWYSWDELRVTKSNNKTNLHRSTAPYDVV